MQLTVVHVSQMMWNGLNALRENRGKNVGKCMK